METKIEQHRILSSSIRETYARARSVFRECASSISDPSLSWIEIMVLNDLFAHRKEKTSAREVAARLRLSKASLSQNLDEYIVTYSHGMRQKIFLIAALMHDPDAFILDEPLTGLDPEASYVIKGLMMEHAMRKKSILISTHVLDVAEKLCTHIGIVDKGKLLFSGTLDELRTMRQEENSSLETLFLELTAK